MRPITKMYVRRRQMGLTQAQIAEEIGVTQPRVSAWETKSAAIPEDRRQQVAKLLDLDPEKLLDEIA